MAPVERSSSPGFSQTVGIVLLILLVYHQLLGGHNQKNFERSNSTPLQAEAFPQQEPRGIDNPGTIRSTSSTTSTAKVSTTTTATAPTSVASARGEIIKQGKKERFQKYFETYHYAIPEHNFSGPAVECGQGPNFPDFFSQSEKYRSRKDEDKKIYEYFFKDKMDPGNIGTYVELGAYNGERASNTRFYDLCLGWKGLLMEGNPGNFEKAETNRPGSHRMQVAPSCSAEYEAVNKTITFARAPSANSGLQGHATAFKNRPQVEVPCGPIGPILEDIFEENQNHVHFFSLDVEGAEVLVMNTLDFTRVQIDIMMIESRSANCQNVCPKREAARAIMKKGGFKGYANVVSASDVYIHPYSKFQLDDKTAAAINAQPLW